LEKNTSKLAHTEQKTYTKGLEYLRMSRGHSVEKGAHETPTGHIIHNKKTDSQGRDTRKRRT